MAREFSFFSSENKQQGGGAGKIYKLVGPVLLAQDKSEAIMAVKARLEFIEKEMYVLLFRSFPFLFLHNDDGDDDDDDQKGLTLLLYLFPNLPWLPRTGKVGEETFFLQLGVLLIRPFSGGDRIESG